MGTYEEVQLSTMSRQVWSKTAAADDLAERARTISRNVRVHRKEMAGGNRYTVVVRLPGRSTAELVEQRHALTRAWS